MRGSNRSLLLLLFVYYYPTSGAFVASLQNDNIVVQRLLQEWGGVGLTTWSINANAQVCTLGMAGERIRGSQQPLATTGDSRHHVGSVTKSMTSTLLGILIQQQDGLIERGWETTMADLIPEAAGGAYADVTLRQLVGMLSGIPGMPEDMQELVDDPDFPATTTPSFDWNDVRSVCPCRRRQCLDLVNAAI